jgi:chemotaxis regulatin CheY-phosphate phosphatase CheZ
MAREIPTSFTRYELSESEQVQAVLLNDLQTKNIQNLLADVAEEKIRLTYDPLNPILFAQQEADLTGKLAILQYILSSAQESALKLAQEAMNKIDTQ